MKKLLYSMMFLSLGFFITSCDETTTDPDPVGTTGNVIIQSTPAGAQIWVGTTNTNDVTPDTLKNRTAGTLAVTLKLADYKDTTFNVTVTANQTTTHANVIMTATPLVLESFTDIQLFERAGSGLSGLVLATGTVVASSSVNADLFYDLTEIKSQHLRTPAPATLRYTDFYNGVTATDLNDGVDAPTYSSTSGDWTYTKAITASTYSFLYTNDLNFVKLKITATGGGTGPSDPDKWVKVSYKYNKTARDKRF